MNHAVVFAATHLAIIDERWDSVRILDPEDRRHSTDMFGWSPSKLLAHKQAAKNHSNSMQAAPFAHGIHRMYNRTKVPRSSSGGWATGELQWEQPGFMTRGCDFDEIDPRQMATDDIEVTLQLIDNSYSCAIHTVFIPSLRLRR